MLLVDHGLVEDCKRQEPVQSTLSSTATRYKRHGSDTFGLRLRTFQFDLTIHLRRAAR